ncbi:MAG TPA: site-specific integrase [Trinickia sp.]|uniref:site-specific integrase n=1 Tax=Trinickia sp. TaxID=2571163 RepID=UPI002B91AF8B|nr:site-specific integrase [Trinickia sp.]HVW49903.1 site-specific integrase [Trinickia sp.]
MNKKITDFNLDLLNEINRDLTVTFNNASYEFDMNDQYEREEYFDLKERIKKQETELIVNQSVNVSNEISKQQSNTYKSKFKYLEVKEAYVKERSLKSGGKITKSINVYLLTYKEFEDVCLAGSNPYITSITKLTAKSFKDHLVKSGIKAQTVDLKLAHLQSFFTWIIKNYDYPFTNPFEGLKLLSREELKKATSSYKPFTREEIKKIFSKHTYKDYYKKNIQYYYVPLIQLYTSMRVEEASQLYLDDIVKEDDIYYFSVNDEDEKSVKNNNAIRKIPIHSKLIELEFLKYYELRKLKGFKTLFDNQGDSVTNAFSDYLKAIEIKKTQRVYSTHSLRKSFNNALIDNDVILDVRCKLCGHELENINSSVYGKEFSVAELKKYIELVQFEFDL